MLEFRAGRDEHIPVPCGIDNDLGEYCLPARLAFEENSFHRIPFHYGAGSPGMEQQVDSCFRHHVIEFGLEHFGIQDRGIEQPLPSADVRILAHIEPPHICVQVILDRFAFGSQAFDPLTLGNKHRTMVVA